jgi:hypothetical protein
MTIEDVLANAMGKRKVSVINRNTHQLVTYLHTDDMIADLEVDPELGSLYGIGVNANGRCTITTSSWNTCKLTNRTIRAPCGFRVH